MLFRSRVLFDRHADGSPAHRLFKVGKKGQDLKAFKSHLPDDATVAEVEWAADHGFVATYVPGYLTHPAMPPLFDASWDPFWATCASRGIAVVIHAGFGTPQGVVYPQLERIYRDVAAAAGTNGYEVLCRLGGRFHRVYRDEGGVP